MPETNDRLIAEAARYVEELHWILTVVKGSGKNPKAPMYRGWPNFRPDSEHVRAILEFNAEAQIGINLGGSMVIDVEADSAEGESLLDDLCRGEQCPSWQASRGKHRLFQADDSIHFLKISQTAIEFRTGRHQSVLPPSVIAGKAYQWLKSPFTVPVPPLPDRLREFYFEQAPNPANQREHAHQRSTKQRWPYRDDRDYVLRRFDLQVEAAKAGLQFVFDRPDANGNIPCFVPANLRSDNEDERPSGVFNIYNGVLRDFATGKNHRFFKVMESLKGEPWQHIFAQFEAEAGAVAGRPHSRRVSFPDASSTDDRTPLEEARAELGRYYEQQLDREPQPGVIHVIKGPPGLGKTYTLCQQLGQKKRKAIILTLENKLARTHQGLLQQDGNVARRMPVLRETACPHPDDYEATARRGFKPSQSFPCRKCSIGPSNCAYLLGFSAMTEADQLCAAAIYHTHHDFYASHGNDNRPILVFDENCIDLLLEPVSHSIHDWRNWSAMVQRWKPDHDLSTAFSALVDWLERAQQEFLRAIDDNGDKVKFRPVAVPDDIRIGTLASTSALTDWLDKNAYKEANRQVQNLTNAALYLLTEPTGYVLFERIIKEDGDIVIVRFRKKNPLPKGKEVFILDATANEELIKAVAPGWDIKVWECPPIQQAGHVIQIMDYDVSRRRIRREVAHHEPHNSSWLVQVVDAILEEHGPAAVISFKDVVAGNSPEMDLIGQLKHRDRITALYNFPCRGHTFDDENLIVIGTPYKDQASIWELALAIWGQAALPESKYMHREDENGCFIARNMAYEEVHLRPLQDFIVSADLVQAIGRVRPLQRPSKVFVLSNAPIFDWDVEQFMASELFDLRQPLRQDAADRYSNYLGAAQSMLEKGQWITNSEICGLLSMPERTGSGYWIRLKDDLRNDVEVKSGRMRKKPRNLTF